MSQDALAIDLGASGGRHILGRMEEGRITLTEAYRFPNEMVWRDGRRCWDMDALFAHVIAGMRACAERGRMPATVGIDTWGVDYTLIDDKGTPLGQSVAYRDTRTDGMPDRLDAVLPPRRLYARTGIARQSYNTVYQLMAEGEAHPGRLSEPARLLFTPCYLNFLLTGIPRNEHTIASTSGLMNARSRVWDKEVLRAAAIPERLMGGPPVEPGTILGPVLHAVEQQVGYACTVVMPASHDTASAFLAAPLSGENAAVLSSGTWSLLGQELDAPILTQAARRAGFTNESGYGGRTTLVRNLMGLWIMQSIRHEWGDRHSYEELAALATKGRDYPHVFCASDERFLAPRSMVDEIAAALREAGAPLPSDEAKLMYCVHRSLALCYREAVRNFVALTDKPVDQINVVGGGSQNATLNQLTADATGLPVCAGPVEATALGNLIAQWMATKEIGSLESARRLIRDGVKLKVFHPQGSEGEL